MMRLGPSHAATLVCPGTPDWIGTDGVRLGWLLRDRLFLRDGDDVIVVSLPDFGDDVAAGPDRWVVSMEDGFVLVDPVAAEVTGALMEEGRVPVSTRPGADAAVIIDIPENQLIRTKDGLPLPLPDAPLGVRWLAPFATGMGAVWVDSETLYRLGAPDDGSPRIAALGRVSGVEALRGGPRGAVLVQCKDSTVVAAPRGIGVRLTQRVLADSARFSPDGGQALAATESGLVLLDLHEGVVRRVWEGNLAPVGFLGGVAVRWDVGSGVLLDEADNTIGTGFTGAAPSAAGDWIAGPGGAVWSVATGACLRRGLEGVCATDGRALAIIDDECVTVTEAGVDGTRTFRHGFLAEDPVDAAHLSEGTLTLRTMDGEAAAFLLAGGSVAWRRRDAKAARSSGSLPAGLTLSGEDSTITIDDRAFPLPADAAIRTPTRTWLWNDEGMLAWVVTDRAST